MAERHRRLIGLLVDLEAEDSDGGDPEASKGL